MKLHNIDTAKFEQDTLRRWAEKCVRFVATYGATPKRIVALYEEILREAHSRSMVERTR